MTAPRCVRAVAWPDASRLRPGEDRTPPVRRGFNKKSSPENQEMQERAHEKAKTLCPCGGSTVAAFERELGKGTLTLTGQSLLFSGLRMAPLSASTSQTSG